MWVKKRHNVTFTLLRPVFRVFTKLRYNYSAQPYPKHKKGPFLILSNHQTTLDPFFMAISFNFPIYYLASDDLFNHRLFSPIIRFLVNPIPKSKAVKDFQAVRDMVAVLKQGGSVALFPEGDRTYTGIEWDIDLSISKLVKISKVPLLLYNINGGFGSDPRFGRGVRKGKMTGAVIRTIEPEEYRNMTDSQLLTEIKQALAVNELATKERFRSRKSAEYLERLLFWCPDCGGIGTLASKGQKLSCTACGMEVIYTDNLKFKPVSGNCPFNTVAQWSDAQAQRLAAMQSEIPAGSIYFTDSEVILSTYKKGEVKRKLETGVLTATDSAITVEGKTQHRFLLSDILSIAIVGKHKLNFYAGDNIYQLQGGKRFNSVKYVMLCKMLTQAKH